MPKCTINGREIELRDGQTIMEGFASTVTERTVHVGPRRYCLFGSERGALPLRTRLLSYRTLTLRAARCNLRVYTLFFGAVVRGTLPKLTSQDSNRVCGVLFVGRLLGTGSPVVRSTLSRHDTARHIGSFASQKVALSINGALVRITACSGY